MEIVAVYIIVGLVVSGFTIAISKGEIDEISGSIVVMIWPIVLIVILFVVGMIFIESIEERH